MRTMLKSSMNARQQLNSKPYSGIGDIVESTLYDSLTITTGVLEMTFFQAGQSGTKQRGLTNLEGNGAQLPSTQRFAVDAFGLRFSLLTTGILGVSVGLVQKELAYALQSTYFEPFLSSKQHMGSFHCLDLFPTLNLTTDAGTVGTSESRHLATAWRRIRVPLVIEPNNNFGARLVLTSLANWPSNVYANIRVTCILKGFLKRLV